VFQTFEEAWSNWSENDPDPTSHELRALTSRLLSEPSLWGRDLTTMHPNLPDRVADDLEGLMKDGVRRGLARLDLG
jgi:hypothetical protein